GGRARGAERAPQDGPHARGGESRGGWSLAASRTGGTPLSQRTIRSGSRRRGGRSPPAPTTWSWGGRSPVLRTRPRPRPPSSPSSAGHDRPRDARSLRDNRRPAARPLPADLGPPLGRLSPVGARPAEIGRAHV